MYRSGARCATASRGRAFNYARGQEKELLPLLLLLLFLLRRRLLLRLKRVHGVLRGACFPARSLAILENVKFGNGLTEDLLKSEGSGKESKDDSTRQGVWSRPRASNYQQLDYASCCKAW